VSDHKDMTLEEAMKSPTVRAEAIEFLLEATVSAAQKKGFASFNPMTVLEIGTAALKVLGITDEELSAVTKKMVENRLASILGRGNVN
jgi:hypothetical protein